MLAYINLPFMNELEADAKEAFGEVKDELKGQIKDVEFSKSFF